MQLLVRYAPAAVAGIRGWWSSSLAAALVVIVAGCLASGCSSGTSAPASRTGATRSNTSSFVDRADAICKRYARRVEVFERRMTKKLQPATQPERKRLLAQGFVEEEGILRSEARELKQLKPPADASSGWFNVLAQIRNDAGNFGLSATELSRGGQWNPPLGEQTDPATTRFLKKQGLTSCLAYRQGLPQG